MGSPSATDLVHWAGPVPAAADRDFFPSALDLPDSDPFLSDLVTNASSSSSTTSVHLAGIAPAAADSDPFSSALDSPDTVPFSSGLAHMVFSRLRPSAPGASAVISSDVGSGGTPSHRKATVCRRESPADMPVTSGSTVTEGHVVSGGGDMQLDNARK